MFANKVSASAVPATHELPSLKGTTEILLSQLDEACLQNDIETWQAQWQLIVNNILEPMLAAVRSGKISGLELITHHSAYVLKPWHRWRFWA